MALTKRLPYVVSLVLTKRHSKLGLWGPEYHFPHKTVASRNVLRMSKTHLDGLSHEQTIVFGQLFAGHVVGSRPMKRKGKMHLVIRTITLGTLW